MLPKSKMTLTILLRNLWCLIMLCGICVFGAMQQKCIKLHLSCCLCLSFFAHLRRARHQSLYINFICIHIFISSACPDWMTSSYNFCILLSAFYHRVSLPREMMRECVYCAGSRLWYEVLAYLPFSHLLSLSLSLSSSSSSSSLTLVKPEGNYAIWYFLLNNKKF